MAKGGKSSEGKTRKRKEYTLQQKIEILNEVKKTNNVSATAKKFETSRRHVQKLRETEDSIRSAVDTGGHSGNRKRIRNDTKDGSLISVRHKKSKSDHETEIEVLKTEVYDSPAKASIDPVPETIVIHDTESKSITDGDSDIEVVKTVVVYEKGSSEETESTFLPQTLGSSENESDLSDSGYVPQISSLPVSSKLYPMNPPLTKHTHAEYSGERGHTAPSDAVTPTTIEQTVSPGNIESLVAEALSMLGEQSTAPDPTQNSPLHNHHESSYSFMTNSSSAQNSQISYYTAGLAPQTTSTSLDSQPGCSHWTQTSAEVTSQEPMTSQSVSMRIRVGDGHEPSIPTDESSQSTDLAPQTTFTSLDSQPGCSHWSQTSEEVTSQEPLTSQSVQTQMQVDHDEVPSVLMITASQSTDQSCAVHQCDFCELKKKEISQKADKFCSSCNKYICETHGQLHDELYGGTHEIVTFKVVQLSILQSDHCTKHPGFIYVAGCVTCTQMFCPQCLCDGQGHPHKTVPLQKLGSTLKAYLDYMLTKLEKRQRDVDEELAKTLTQIEQLEQKEMDKVKEYFASLKADLWQKIQGDLKYNPELYKELSVIKNKERTNLTGDDQMSEIVNTFRKTFKAIPGDLDRPERKSYEVRSCTKKPKGSNLTPNIGVDIIHSKSPPRSAEQYQNIILPVCVRIKVMFHHQAVTYYTDGNTNKVYYREASQPDIESTLLETEERIRDMCLHRDKIYIITCSSLDSFKMNVYSLNGDPMRSWDLPDYSCNITAAGDHIVVHCLDNELYLYSEAGEQIKSIRLTQKCDKCVQIGDHDIESIRKLDDKSILLYCEDGVIKRYSIRKEEVIWTFEHHKEICDAVYDGHGNIIGLDVAGDLLTLDVSSGEKTGDIQLSELPEAEPDSVHIVDTEGKLSLLSLEGDTLVVARFITYQCQSGFKKSKQLLYFKLQR